MDPISISPTIQEFLGQRYYLCGRYFQREGKRLHIAVWEAAHGPVPKGHHVHHANHVKTDNRLENLELLTRFAHQSHHGQTPTKAQRAARRRNVKAAAKGNARLTGEERSIASKAGWASMTPAVVACTVCGRAYETWFPGRAQFCGGTCRARALRARARGNRPATRSGKPALTREQVERIRALLHQGISQTTIAREFGVSQPTISNINRGKVWRN